MGTPSFERLRVLDLSRYLPGGYATQLLADFGADVIKIEDTGLGDFCRHEKPQQHGMSYYIEALGRNKRSIALNLKDENAHEAFMKLVDSADIVVESFRPGVTKKLGIDYDAVRARNPRIIYCSFSGYGQEDPRSQQPLHDINMQAQSGYLSLNGGVKAPLHLCDLASAMVAAQSMLAALYDREISGEGRVIDISMFDSFVWWNSLLDTRWCFQDGSLTEDTIIYPADCCFYNIYETKDGGKLAFGLIEEKFWKTFCERIERPDLIEQPAGTYEAVKNVVASKTLSEWETWLSDADLCIAPVINKTEAIEQLLNREPHMMAYLNFPHAGKVLQTNLPHDIKGMRPDIASFTEAPMLGEHTSATLKEMGYSDKRIAELAEAGAIRIAE